MQQLCHESDFYIKLHKVAMEYIMLRFSNVLALVGRQNIVWLLEAFYMCHSILSLSLINFKKSGKKH